MPKDRKIHAEVYPHTKSPQFFKNEKFEFLTRTHPVIILSMYWIIAASLIPVFVTNYATSTAQTVGLFFVGFFSWTLAEYILHRFLLHDGKSASFDADKLRYTLHGIHHKYPNDEERIVLPPLPSLIIAMFLFGMFYFPFGKYAFVLMPGFVVGYSIYMFTHYCLHKFKAPKRFSFWWDYHNIHHFQQHDRAFGVTSAFWDYVFFTRPEKGRRTVYIKSNRKRNKVDTSKSSDENQLKEAS